MNNMYFVPCSHCGQREERSAPRKDAICFDCKRRLHLQRSMAYYNDKRRKGVDNSTFQKT